MNRTLKDLELRITELENQIQEDTEESHEENLFEIEEEIENLSQAVSEQELGFLKNLSKKIQRIKKENDFYDKESVLDMMFPNRHDEGFDEDSMSYESVFGDD